MSTSRSGRKGQTAIEFLSMVTILMIVFAGMYTTVGEQKVALLEEQVQLRAKALADTVAFELDLALTSGNGFQRTTSFTNGLGGAEYNITVVNGTILIEWLESQALSSTAVDRIAGSPEPGENTFTNNGTHVVVIPS